MQNSLLPQNPDQTELTDTPSRYLAKTLTGDHCALTYRCQLKIPIKCLSLHTVLSASAMCKQDIAMNTVALMQLPGTSYKPSREGAPMDQAELIEKVAKELGISNAQSQRLLKATLREIRDLLRVGHAVTIPHLGTFDTATYDEHRGYRPVSHDFAIFPKRRVPVFRTGSLLREEVYDIEADEAGATS